jgi:hypothetical protein
VKPLLPSKINECVSESMHMRVCVGVGVGVCSRACSLTYPACNAHSPYYLRPLQLHNIFRHYHQNGVRTYHEE